MMTQEEAPDASAGEPQVGGSGSPVAPRTGHASAHDHRLRNRVLRVRITDVETERLKVGLTLPIGLVSVATRLGARLVPPVPNAAALLEAIERDAVVEPVILHDEQNGERIEINLEG